MLVAAALAGTAAARVDAGGAASKTVNVAFIYPKTGGLAAFGQEELDGFQAGLAYTSGKCGGYTINPTYIDDATDPATAINAFKNEVGQGVKIIAGTGSSGIALQLGPLAAQNNVLYISGAAAADAITGLNRNTFRAGRQTLQDVLDAANIFPPKSTGKKIVVFAEDTAFGAGNVAAVQLIFGGKGHDGLEDPLAVRRRRPDAVRAAAEELRRRRGLRRLGEHDQLGGDVAVAAAAGRREADDAHHGPREPRELRRARPARPGRDAALALRLPGAAQRGEHVPHQVDGEEPPRGAGPVHAGRLRHRADDLPRGREGRHGHVEADQRARGLAVPRAEGQAVHPAGRITR